MFTLTSGEIKRGRRGDRHTRRCHRCAKAVGDVALLYQVQKQLQLLERLEGVNFWLVSGLRGNFKALLHEQGAPRRRSAYSPTRTVDLCSCWPHEDRPTPAAIQSDRPIHVPNNGTTPSAETVAGDDSSATRMLWIFIKTRALE